MDNDRIRSLIFDLGAEEFRRGKDWNEYKVFIPIYKNSPTIGLPLVVLVNKEEARISTDEESLQYLEFEQKNA